MTNRSNEKFNPFLDEEDVSITSSAELEEAKRLAGVVTTDEHRKRMLDSGDVGLINEVKKIEISEKIEELRKQSKIILKQIEELHVGAHRSLYMSMFGVEDTQEAITRDQKKLNLLQKEKRPNQRADLYDLKNRIERYKGELLNYKNQINHMVREMGLADNITLPEVKKLWTQSELQEKALFLEEGDILKQIQILQSQKPK